MRRALLVLLLLTYTLNGCASFSSGNVLLPPAGHTTITDPPGSRPTVGWAAIISSRHRQVSDVRPGEGWVGQVSRVR